MPDPTLGATAYDAYWQVHRHDGHFHAPPPFAMLPEITRASWEAAAQAVVHMVWDAAAAVVAEQALPELREVQRILHEAQRNPHG